MKVVPPIIVAEEGLLNGVLLISRYMFNKEINYLLLMYGRYSYAGVDWIEVEGRPMYRNHLLSHALLKYHFERLLSLRIYSFGVI